MRITIVSTIIGVALIMLSVVGGYSDKLLVWTGIVAKEVETQIDDLLGKEKVMRQQALDAIDAAQADISRLQDLVVASSVDAELATERLTEMRLLEAQAQKQLGQLGTMIEKREPIETADGTLWQIADLQAYAETKIVEYDTLLQRIQILEESRAVHQETATRANSAMLATQQNAAKMAASLELLDAKIALLQALKSQPENIRVSNPQVDNAVADTENLLDTLLEEVERELGIARAREKLQRAPVQNESSLPPLPAVNDDLVDQLYSLSDLGK